MIIAVIILLIICIILCYFLAKKVKIDKSELEYFNNALTSLKNQKSVLETEINFRQGQKDLIEQEIAKDTSFVNSLKKSNEEIANEAYSNYVKILETSYKDREQQYDINIARLKEDIRLTQQELTKLKETRAAAHEALLKEQEIKENKDNYKLSPSQADLADARRLEIVKRELNKPRILSMLIWQTYWQPLAKKQFPLILQDKTKCGIYKITNLITDECYIGQAVDIYKRWNEHCKCGLGIDTPPGNKLYKSMQEYGLENFTFELLTECKQTELNEKEKYFIELYQANIYGMNSTGGNR